MARSKYLQWVVLFGVLLLAAGCAAGNNNEWTEADPAGFFAGLWHGILLLITLIVSFFTNDVTIYEVSNNGTAYNIGFVLGVMGAYGGGTKITIGRPKKRKKKKDKEEWDRVAKRVEANVKAKLKGLLDSDDDPEWKELGEKFERKLKQKLRNWLNEDDAGSGNGSEGGTV